MLEYYSVKKRSKAILFGAIQMQWVIIILSEISQKRKKNTI